MKRYVGSKKETGNAHMRFPFYTFVTDMNSELIFGKGKLVNELIQ